MTFATSESAGFDLRALGSGIIQPGCFSRVAVEYDLSLIKAGTVGLVCPRSGLAMKGVTVLNGPGVVDADYEGEVGVVLINFGGKPFVIAEGDRVAQMVLLPLAARSDSAAKRVGGFGSTG